MSEQLTLSGARLVGGDGTPVDLVVSGDRLVDVLPAGRGPGHHEPLDGRWVMAGLWDHHVHMDQWALSRQRFDLRATTSAADAAEVVRTRVREGSPPADVPLIGYGFHDALWPDRPTTELLDDAAGTTPVALYSNDIHCAWVSTAAWRLLGRDSGPAIVREEDFQHLVEALRTHETASLPTAVREAVDDAAARGVVGIVELEWADAVAAWSERVASGVDRLRVECGAYPDLLDATIARGLASGDVVDGTRGLVSQGPLKVITDGSLGTRTAYCDAAYPGLEDSEHPHGMLVVPPEQLLPLLRRGCAHGLEPAVHAIGDHANALVLDTFSQLGHPGRIEHAQLLRPGDVARFAALGVAASIQPAHCPDDRDIADRYWPTTVDRAFPFRALHDAGVTLLFGSDAPVAPLDPWVAIAAAVRRTADDRPPWHPEQQLPVRVALQASIRGDLPLVAGGHADLVVLDADPLSVPAEALADLPVHATMLAGRWTFHADSGPA